MNKFIVLLVALTLVLGGCQTTNTSKTDIKEIGIIQIVEHEALDQARLGFIEGLKEAGFIDGKNIKIEYKNASGDGAVLNTIAESFASSKKDLVFAVATPSAQAMTLASESIPVVFTAVTDPIAAKLVNTLEKPGTMATGTIDAVDIKKQFELIKAFMPKANKIGILFNTSEVNSQVQVQQAKDEAKAFGFTIVEKGITSTTEIEMAANALLEQVDVIYVPTDNLVASSIAMLSDIATKAGKPIFAAEPGPVSGGALATDGIDYHALGKQSAKQAIKILEGTSPSEIPVESNLDSVIVINETVLKQLNLQVPEQIKEKATFVK